MDIDWVVLDNEREPDRLARFRANNSGIDLPVDPFAATDHLEIDNDDLKANGLLASDYESGWMPRAIANALTHWLCWYQALEGQKPIGILEDSAVLRGDFVAQVQRQVDTLGSGWDVLQLGCNTNSILDIELSRGLNFRAGFAQEYSSAEDLKAFGSLTDVTAPVRLHRAFGSFAYIVTPAGAEKLIEGCFPIAVRPIPVHSFRTMLDATSIDGLMNRLYPSVAAYIAVPPLAVRDKGTTETVAPDYAEAAPALAD